MKKEERREVLATLSNLKQQLKGKLKKEELDKVKNAFDIIGSIAILEIPHDLRKKKKIIAKAVRNSHKNVESVYLEKGGRSGKYRLQKLELIAGEKKTETVAAENGIRLKVDVSKVYFSPRQSSERKRICDQIKKDQEVMVMFSGAGPYVVEIAKNTPAKSVFGIEANRSAHKYAIENVAINKVEGKVKLFCGSVEKIMPQMRKKFDRIIMPLPKEAYKHLPLALKRIKKNGTIHYYDFLPVEEIKKTTRERIISASKKTRSKVRILRRVKCGQLAPRSYRVCTEFKVG